ncbi:MAG: hypothetical protein EWV42_11420 [Microcystis panniformis Mp_GB_SS_20050300_S99D]|nr:MAG: hypothetical protein EWV42_11420 [Microcystis panniformis Mp_GB_SS_20050300_S99D]
MWWLGSSRFCVISLTYIGSIGLCVLCVWCGSLHSLASRTVSQNYATNFNCVSRSNLNAQAS